MPKWTNEIRRKYNIKWRNGEIKSSAGNWLYQKDICRFCKKKSEFLVKFNRYKICRQCNKERMHKYYLTKKGKERVKIAVNKSIEKYPEKQRARQTLARNILNGKVLKPKKCSKCSIKTRVQAHHEDYTKPLDVLWLCSSCHADIHRFKKDEFVV